MALLTLAVGMNSLLYGGTMIDHIDIAPSFAGVLIGISNTFRTLPGIIGAQFAKRIDQELLVMN